MATLTAPYAPAMRLGQGFNSFTQELRVYDAVTNTRSSKTSVHYQTHPQQFAYLTSAEDMFVNVDRTVSYCAKLVNRISQVTDLLNVSAPRQIKSNATSGGGASGLVIDFSKFYESDINFFIHVSVANRHLTAPDLTEFSPIEGTSPSDFARVYGDTFISGFTEGGEFSALVSIKLNDKSIDVSGQLKALFDFKSGSVDGQEKAKSIEGETTIYVSWSGGGEISSTDADDWTLEKLKAVALKFPQHVMTCPARTSAILTKYTSLRSAQVAAIKTGSPLDYGNTTLYSSALLDAYMEYKTILQRISHSIGEVECGLSTLECTVDVSQFADSAREAKAHYQAAMDKYKKQSAMDDTISATSDDDCMSTLSSFSVIVGATARKREPPVRPNELVPYSADIRGLDAARWDCQIEMAKIVKEVEAVAADPNVVADADRRWAYLSPAIFRLLLPTVRNLGKEQAAKEAAQTVAAQAATFEEMHDDLANTKRKLNRAEAVLHKLKPYSFLPSIGVDTPLKFKSASTGKVFDYHIHAAGGSCRQWDPFPKALNQKFKIVEANGLGHHISHCDSGRHLAANAGSSSGDSMIPLILSENFGSVFVFEQAGDDTVRIRLAAQPSYTVVVPGGKHDNGAQLLLQLQSTKTVDKWRVEAWQ